MSKPINISDTITVNPSGINTSQSSYSTGSNNANAYTNTSSTTYSSIACNTGRGATSYVTYTFNLSSIPEDATIDSVTCTAKATVSNTSYIATATLQLYSDTTAKGSTTSFRSTSQTIYDLSVGTWTRSELLNARIRATATRGTSNTTRSAYIYFYGADLTVNYSINGTAYTVAATSNVDGITVSPASEDIFEGGSATLTIEGISDLSDISITDNDNDISSLLVEKQPSTGGTATKNLGAYTLVSGGFNSSGATFFQGRVGYGDNASTTSSNYYSSSSGTIAVFTYDMSFTDIPSNATITNVYVKVSGHAESTSQNSEYVCAQLISGSTNITSELNFKSTGSTSNSVQTLTATTIPTIEQLANLKLQCRLGYYGGAINGATCYVEYTVPVSSSYYEYTIFNINADHVILIDNVTAFIPPEEDPEYTYYPITISSINATTNPGTGTTRVVEGSNQTITIYPDDPVVTLILDNGQDVTSQLVSHAGTSPTYSVATVSGADYGFNLNNSTGYYVSGNTGVDKSTALSRVTFDLPVRCLVTISYINYAEETYDFGVFGKVDTQLSTTYWQSTQSGGDTTTDVGLEQLRCNTSTYNSSSVQTLTYEIPAGEHFIDIKFSKDNQTADGNDSLQWKIDSIQELEPNNYYTYTLSNITQKHNLIFVFGNVSFYYITSAGSNCRLYPDGQFVELEGDNYKLTIVPNNNNDSIYLTDNGTDKTSSLQRVESRVEKDGNIITYINYTYLLTNITANHNLVVTCTSGQTIYIKINGSWISFGTAYKKTNDEWREVSNLSELFDTEKVYTTVLE